MSCPVARQRYPVHQDFIKGKTYPYGTGINNTLAQQADKYGNLGCRFAFTFE
jgi:hypothetical protein